MSTELYLGCARQGTVRQSPVSHDDRRLTDAAPDRIFEG